MSQKSAKILKKIVTNKHKIFALEIKRILPIIYCLLRLKSNRYITKKMSSLKPDIYNFQSYVVNYISNSVDNNRSSCSAVTFKVSLAPIASDMVPVSSDTIITIASVRSEIPKAARCLKPKNLGISVF